MRRPLPVVLRLTLAVAATAHRDPETRAALSEALARLPAALARRRPLPPGPEADIRLLERPARPSAGARRYVG